MWKDGEMIFREGYAKDLKNGRCGFMKCIHIIRLSFYLTN